MIGILALQGGFKEHEQILNQLDISSRQVRSMADTEGLTGFIIPGGESTVMDLFIQEFGLKDWLIRQAQNPHFKILGTCAGLILLARYGLLDVTVERNAYGRQVASFLATVDCEGVGLVRGHFIRAPKIVGIGAQARVLAEYEGVPVAVRQGSVWGLSFHPELAGDPSLHAVLFS